MALPIYRVNGGTSLAGVQANWDPQIKRRESGGVIVYQSCARLLWDIESLPAATYVALEALNGQILDTLETSDFDDPTQGTSYSGAEMVGISGSQTGQRVTGIHIEFRVKVD
ncbi:MAG: hypothetical protein BroJett011_04060 [Chloroflexota bacterium]|nr:MAG: hypothetical protein BroJett011_04060 [Chloroflexota bacterium]